MSIIHSEQIELVMKKFGKRFEFSKFLITEINPQWRIFSVAVNIFRVTLSAAVEIIFADRLHLMLFT